MNSNGAVPKIVYDNARINVKFNGNLLKRDNVTYNHGPTVNVYIVYRLTADTKDSIWCSKLTKNVDIDKYKYSGYGIGFDSRTSFTHPSGGDGRNVIIFGLIINFTVDNKTFCLKLHYNGDSSYLFVQ